MPNQSKPMTPMKMVPKGDNIFRIVQSVEENMKKLPTFKLRRGKKEARRNKQALARIKAQRREENNRMTEYKRCGQWPRPAYRKMAIHQLSSAVHSDRPVFK